MPITYFKCCYFARDRGFEQMYIEYRNSHKHHNTISNQSLVAI